ncbi:SNF2 family N-terminal domain-containing protein [Pelagophyceae sp. CCMP2097]|nr:SNF2 family N-terminal domain-containing protein [Pelagophyceae sp. CCMP2097]
MSAPPPQRPRASSAVAAGSGAGEARLLLFLASRACLESEALRLLAVGEQHAVRAVSRRVRATLARGVDYVHARGAAAGAPGAVVPYPGFPGLFAPRGGGEAGPRGLFVHQLASLRAMRRAEDRDTAYGALRGGVLADAPGLGKTVTVLALVLATAGQQPREPAAFFDAARVNEAWAAWATSELELEQALLPGLRPLVGHVDYLKRHGPAADLDAARALLRAALPPYATGTSISALEAAVRRGAATLPGAPPALRDVISGDFHHILALVKARLDPRRRAAGLGARAAAERCLKATGATLVVVPDALLDHWRVQLQRHLYRPQLAPSFGDGVSGRGVAYVDGTGDLADDAAATDGAAGAAGARQAALGAPLPSANVLRQFLIVVVPFSRCAAAAQEEAERRAAADRGYYRLGKTQDAADSPLMNLRWLRLVVDEGHDLAASAPCAQADAAKAPKKAQTKKKPKKKKTAPNDEASQLGLAAVRFISELFAERRWVVSGTPTTGDVDAADAAATALAQLQRLLTWLRHPVYGVGSDVRLDRAAAASSSEALGAAWCRDIAGPFLHGGDAAGAAALSARAKLVSVLADVVVRHRKEDVPLPRPVFSNVEVEVERTAAMDEDAYQWAVDSALGARVVDVVREARAGQKAVKVAVFSQHDADLQSVAEVLYAELGAASIAEFNVRRLGQAPSSRELSRFQTDRMFTRACPLCGAVDDADAKGCARPLMEVEFLEEDAVRARRNAFDAEMPHAGGFDAGAGDAFDASAAAGTARARRALVEPERIVRAVSRRQGIETDAADYAADFRLWVVGDEFDVSTAARGFAPRPSYRQWRKWGAANGERRAARQAYESADGYFGPVEEPAAAAQPAWRRVRLVKWAPCSKWHGPGWYRGPHFDDAKAVVVAAAVPVLCLYRDASHGLDLSFLTHIFLLEPLRDSALLEQVVSRAHRVGATAPVQVVTLMAFAKTEDEPADSAETRPGQGFKICDHCYKSFEVEADADGHMLVCSRNPQQRAAHRRSAPFTIDAVFDEIRPPPATAAQAVDDAAEPR